VADGDHVGLFDLVVSPALRLYARIGFEEAYRYWYRVQPA
jgi:hypothetical protein